MSVRLFLHEFGPDLRASQPDSSSTRLMAQTLRRLAFFLVFLLPLPAMASCTGASPTWTTTIDSSSVQACINGAADGDTINVSSGSASWSGVSIPSSKGVTLACPSKSCTISGSGLGFLTINAGSTSTGSAVTGFSFTGGTIQLVIASAPPYDTMPRLYNNTFTTSGTFLEVDGLGPGLFDHNTVNATAEAAETIHFFGDGDGCTSCWNVDVVPGSADMFFAENNVWNAASNSAYCQMEEAYYGSIIVLRYNQSNNCQTDVHATDHGNRWIESYHNTFNNCCSSGSFFDWRGGSGVFWDNTNTGSTNGNTGLGPEGSDQTGSYPVPYQFGMGIGGTNYSPNYIWGNSAPMQSYNVTNRSMVAAGASPTGCSGLSGTTCNAIVTATQPATLERCESAADLAAGCPVSYAYTPYAYPHPQDNCSPSQFGAGATCGISPSAPINLSGTVQTQ